MKNEELLEPIIKEKEEREKRKKENTLLETPPHYLRVVEGMAQYEYF